MFVKTVEESHKRLKMKQLCKTNPDEAIEVMMRETATGIFRDIKEIIFVIFKK